MQKEDLKPFAPQDAQVAILSGLTIDRNVLSEFEKHRIEIFWEVVMTDPDPDGVLKFWAAAHAALSLLPSQKAAAGGAGLCLFSAVLDDLKTNGYPFKKEGEL